MRAAVLCVTMLAACGGMSQTATDAAPESDAAAPDTTDAALETTGDVPDASDAADAAPAWRPLLDGHTFAGWQRYLGKPSAGEAPLGLENDPRGVFSFVDVDGGRALRITGETWGALISDETICDFHLRGQYKWGTLIWPPLNYRDSGLMYLSTGPLGAVNAGGPALSDPPGSGAFMVALEYQITPTDVGSIAALGPISLESLSRIGPTERADGWNTIDILVKDGVITHSLDGVVVARSRSPIIAWPGTPATPLTCGKLQIQSEGAEIFFRYLEIKNPP